MYVVADCTRWVSGDIPDVESGKRESAILCG